MDCLWALYRTGLWNGIHHADRSIGNDMYDGRSGISAAVYGNETQKSGKDLYEKIIFVKGLWM